MDRRHPPDINRHPPDDKDRHSWLDELPGYIVELEPVEERLHKSEASHNVDSKHLRPLICAEEAVGFHKSVKRIHDPVKFVVPCAVFEIEFHIPPDKGVHLSSYIEGPVEAASIDTDRIPSNDTTYAISNDINKPASIDTTTSTSIDTIAASSIDSGRVSKHKEFDLCGNLFDGETTTRSDKSGGKKRRNWKKRKMTKEAICKASSAPYC
ncbi:hypothetical protein DY000_02015623 [Brassica cretica]|uniref:Uncharacterized protein n=1 Tax=Brassica cretica TaxID=69181 RepID=A0ABQ7D283_BRACR|nr:hypothetical protein DY000_02015623 [Brassica cretica]